MISAPNSLNLNCKVCVMKEAPGPLVSEEIADIISKLTADGLLWRHRHMSQALAIVTSQWPIVPTGIYGRMMLRSARVKGIAITCEAMNCLAHDTILHIVVEWFIAHYGTLGDQTIYTRFGLKKKHFLV